MFRRTAVDDDTAEDRAVPADPLRRAVGDDVCTVVEGPDKVPWQPPLDTHIPMWIRMEYERTSHPESVVNEQRDAVVVRELCELWERCDGVLRVPDAFDINALRLVVDCGSKVGGVFALHELHSDVELLHEH